MIFGGLIVVALFAALIAPWFIDWTAYRTAFEREATKIIGQPVRVAGTAKVRILPLPSVTFTDLTVGENPDGTPMMTVDSFLLNAELMPFLSGEVRIVEMVLERPHVTVVVGEGGDVAWTARKELLVDPQKVTVDNLRIENGSIRIEGLAGGRTIEGEGISASVRAQSLIGPWHIDAEGTFDGFGAAVQISTGRLQEEGAIRVRAVSRREGQPYRLIVDGPLSVKNGVLAWNGQFEVTPASEPAVPGEGVLAPPLEVRAAGRFDATPEMTEISQYRLEIGPRDDPYTITGTAHANIREEIFFEATAEGRQIDLDRLEAAPAQAGEGVSLDQRIAALRRIADRVPVPQARGQIDFTLPAIVAGDTVIREVRANIEPDGDGWRINAFKAALPGNTLVEARGRLGTGGDFGFTGHMVLASRQPTGFAAWLAGKSNAALRRLNTAGFSADVTFSGRQASFDNLELILNEARLKGKLQRLAPIDGRPGIVAELSGERIDTDDLAAVYSLTEKDDGPALTNHDLDISLTAGVLEGMGVVARDVDAHVRVEAGSVSVDRLNAGEFYGARIVSTGRLADLTDRPSGRFELSVEAEHGARLAEFAAGAFGENRFLSAIAGDPQLSRGLSAKIEVEARPQGEISKGTLTASGWAGGTAFAIRDRFEGQPARWRDAMHDLSMKLQQPEPGILARQLALPVTPVQADGPVTVTADLSGSPGDGLNVDFAAAAPGTDLSAAGRLAFTAMPGSDSPFGSPEFDLDVTLGTQDIDPWLIMAGYPLPGTGEGHPASVTFKAVGKEGVYSIGGLAGTHGDNGFSGELALATQGAGRPKLEGRLAFDRLSLPFAGELLLGPGTIGLADISGEIPDTEFGLPLVTGADAQVAVSARNLDLGGGAEGYGFTGDAIYLDGTLSLPRFSATWLDGTISGNLSLKNAGRSAIINTQLSLSDIDAAALAALGGFARAVSGEADIGVSLDGSGRSFEALVAALSGSGVFTLRRGSIEGITSAGFEAILAEADREDFEIKPETVIPIARKAILGGEFAAEAVSGAFTVGQGRVSVRNVRLGEAGGTLEGGGSYEPLTGRTEIDATLKYDAGKEALAGADPAVDITLSGQARALAVSLNTRALEGYLSLRAFEREQRKVEILQETVLEKQRLRRDILLTRSRVAFREQERREELRRLEQLQQRLEEERRQREEAERKAQEAAREGDGTDQGATQDDALPPIDAPARESRPPEGDGGQAPPVPSPAPRQASPPPAQTQASPPPAQTQASPPPAQMQASPPAVQKKGIVTRPLPAPKNDASSLFEDIRRKLFGQ